MITRQLLVEAGRQYGSGISIRSTTSGSLTSTSFECGGRRPTKLGRDNTRRHSAPPGLLLCSKTAEVDRDVGKEDEGEVWILYDAKALFAKCWLWC